ncbi:MAG: HAD family phosphatase [Clostridia bacterium]|nr:HAD family phosphatase [Clostridia bacterium]
MKNVKNDIIRLIASDIDGTLLRSDGTVSDYTVQVIHKAQEQGILFTVCSGRFPEHAHTLLKNYGIFCPVCGNNGVTLWDAATDTFLMDHLISRDAIGSIWQAAEKLRLSYIVFGRKFVIASDAEANRIARGRFTERLMEDYGVHYYLGKTAVQDALDRPINKFYFYNLSYAERAALNAIPGVTVTSSGFGNAEIIPLGCSKANGVEEMAKLHGFTLDQTMAIGDYDNDVPMLTAAGLGVAMGNAADSVKARVRYVTDTNDQDGMAKAVEKYVL